MIQRHFFRCNDCLGVWSADIEVEKSDVPGPWGRKAMVQGAIAPYLATNCPYDCGAAEGTIEHMGIVTGNNLTRHEGGELPCDSSCCFARGINCDCQCNGANHGGGVLVAYDKYSDQGSLQAIKERNREWLSQGVLVAYDKYSDQGSLTARFKAAPKSLDTARQRAGEWRKFYSLAQKAVEDFQKFPRLQAIKERKRNREWLSQEDFEFLLQERKLVKSLETAGNLKTHASRMNRVRTIINTISSIIGFSPRLSDSL